MGDLIGIASYHPFSKAVAAVHGTLVGGQDKGGLSVLVLHADDNGIIAFAAGVLMAICRRLHRIRNT